MISIKKEADIVTFIIMFMLGIILLPLLPLLIPILVIFATSNNKKKTKKQRFSNNEINFYGLTEEEKQLVKKGNYEPWDFDDDEIIDDDDYYNDSE